jgi:hypothetical protein
MPRKPSPTHPAQYDQGEWPRIITSVTTHLGFFTLVVLATDAIIAVISINVPGNGKIYLIGAALGVLLLTLAVVALLALKERAPSYSVSFKLTQDFPDVDLTEIDWDRAKCFVNFGDKREAIIPAVSEIAPVLQVKLPATIIRRINEHDPVDIELVDLNNHKWRSGSFYLYQTQVKLMCRSSPEAVRSAYGVGL